ncbi:solute carrier family 41 member 1-like [Cloeon dipterum]|uniref:solute carrier family 41 member 1-like n=1 Tax=Cloeon dipterum TaxID=197152 RepID=UPI0032208EAA
MELKEGEILDVPEILEIGDLFKESPKWDQIEECPESKHEESSSLHENDEVSVNLDNVDEENTVPEALPVILESHRQILAQVTLPFLAAGMGMVGAGVCLSIVQHWTVFEQLPEVLILVPPLLGLKGNLEMTLASRMSTAANMGEFKTRRGKFEIVFGNMALLQVQAIVVGLLAAVIAFVMDIELTKSVQWNHLTLLAASGSVTASLASLILGSITSAVIILSNMCNINPDNIATPIAGALGDITALVILSVTASLFYSIIGTHDWVYPVVCAVLISLLPIFIIIARRNKFTKDVLKHGWTPIIIAMLIQVTAGLILDIVANRTKDVAIFQPVVNGVAGNLVAIQASKMSTFLHQVTKLGVLPAGMRIFLSPKTVFFSKEQLSTTARSLMILVVPGHLIFTYTISFAEQHGTSLHPLFILFYLVAVFIQITIVIYCTSVLTHFFWSREKDPDNNTIPYMTAIGDFLGILFMGLVFEILRVMAVET